MSHHRICIYVDSCSLYAVYVLCSAQDGEHVHVTCTCTCTCYMHVHVHVHVHAHVHAHVHVVHDQCMSHDQHWRGMCTPIPVFSQSDLGEWCVCTYTYSCSNRNSITHWVSLARTRTLVTSRGGQYCCAIPLRARTVRPHKFTEANHLLACWVAQGCFSLGHGSPTARRPTGPSDSKFGRLPMLKVQGRGPRS